jgi:hypothetical protein
LPLSRSFPIQYTLPSNHSKLYIYELLTALLNKLLTKTEAVLVYSKVLAYSKIYQEGQGEIKNGIRQDNRTRGLLKAREEYQPLNPDVMIYNMTPGTLDKELVSGTSRIHGASGSGSSGGGGGGSSSSSSSCCCCCCFSCMFPNVFSRTCVKRSVGWGVKGAGGLHSSDTK